MPLLLETVEFNIQMNPGLITWHWEHAVLIIEDLYLLKAKGVP
jgi:hypothetical protein